MKNNNVYDYKNCRSELSGGVGWLAGWRAGGVE